MDSCSACGVYLGTEGVVSALCKCRVCRGCVVDTGNGLARCVQRFFNLFLHRLPRPPVLICACVLLLCTLSGDDAQRMGACGCRSLHGKLSNA